MAWPTCNTQEYSVDAQPGVSSYTAPDGAQAYTITFPEPVIVKSPYGDGIFQLNGAVATYVQALSPTTNLPVFFQTISFTIFHGGRYSGSPLHPPPYSIRLITLDINGGTIDDWAFTFWNKQDFPHGGNDFLVFRKEMNPNVIQLIKAARLVFPAAGWDNNDH